MDKKDYRWIPSYNLLRGIRLLGMAILLTGVGLLAYIVYWEFFSDESLEWDWEGTGIAWYMWGSCLIVGIAITVLCRNSIELFYREVEEGEIIDKDFRVRGDRFSTWSNHLLLLRGKNRAGEYTTDWVSVTENTYQKYKVGDHFPAK